jgi:hypothetical protein
VPTARRARLPAAKGKEVIGVSPMTLTNPFFREIENAE